MVVLAQRPGSRKKKKWKYVKKRKIKKQSLIPILTHGNIRLRNLFSTHVKKKTELKTKPTYHLLDSDTNARENGQCTGMRGGCPAQQVPLQPSAPASYHISQGSLTPKEVKKRPL